MYSISIFSKSPTFLIHLNGLYNQQIKSMTVLIELWIAFVSITAVRISNVRNYTITSKFSFKPVSEKFARDIVNDLSSNKAADGEIPLKVLKECDFSFHFFKNCINEAIKTTCFQTL